MENANGSLSLGFLGDTGDDGRAGRNFICDKFDNFFDSHNPTIYDIFLDTSTNTFYYFSNSTFVKFDKINFDKNYAADINVEKTLLSNGQTNLVVTFSNINLSNIANCAIILEEYKNTNNFIISTDSTYFKTTVSKGFGIIKKSVDITVDSVTYDHYNLYIVNLSNDVKSKYLLESY
jgi:hypothetical protein